MRWTGLGVVLRVCPCGEAHAILTVLTRERGRLVGLVYGGASRRRQAMLQLGNTLSLTWYARTPDRLGRLTCEIHEIRTVEFLSVPYTLPALQTLFKFLLLLPERDPHPHLYTEIEKIFNRLTPLPLFAAHIARFEVLFLKEVGFGLDFRGCPVAGKEAELVWVSPKTGRGVSGEAGRPYASRLLPLPSFLYQDDASFQQTVKASPPSKEQLHQAFRLTGYFLKRRIYTQEDLPSLRAYFLTQVETPAA